MTIKNLCINFNLFSKHSEFEHMKEYNDKVFKTRNSAGNVIT